MMPDRSCAAFAIAATIAIAIAACSSAAHNGVGTHKLGDTCQEGSIAECTPIDAPGVDTQLRCTPVGCSFLCSSGVWPTDDAGPLGPVMCGDRECSDVCASLGGQCVAWQGVYVPDAQPYTYCDLGGPR